MPVTVHAGPAGRTACDTQDQTITDLYYSASWQVLEELQDGNETARNTWSPVYVNALLTREDDTDGTPDRMLHATQDATFNVTGIFDDANAGQEHLVYSAYGQKQVTDRTWTVQSGETLNWKVTYQGGEEDLATGNINFQRRDYNPRTYTWNSADPLGTPDGPSRYAFVAGNPINRIDWTGMSLAPGQLHARFIQAFGPAKNTVVPAVWDKLAQNLNQELRKTDQGARAIRDLARPGVRLFITEETTIWDSKRKSVDDKYPPFAPDYEKNLGGEALPISGKDGIEKHIYIADTDFHDMLRLIVHESMHTNQDTIADWKTREVYAYRAEAQWQIENYNYTAPYVIPTIFDRGYQRYGVDTTAIWNHLNKSGLYTWDPDLESYDPARMNWVTGRKELDFDQGNWVVELGGFELLC